MLGTSPARPHQVLVRAPPRGVKPRPRPSSQLRIRSPPPSVGPRPVAVGPAPALGLRPRAPSGVPGRRGRVGRGVATRCRRRRGRRAGTSALTRTASGSPAPVLGSDALWWSWCPSWAQDFCFLPPLDKRNRGEPKVPVQPQVLVQPLPLDFASAAAAAREQPCSSCQLGEGDAEFLPHPDPGRADRGGVGAPRPRSPAAAVRAEFGIRSRRWERNRAAGRWGPQPLPGGRTGWHGLGAGAEGCLGSGLGRGRCLHCTWAGQVRG